jgi:hypothetical protein
LGLEGLFRNGVDISQASRIYQPQAKTDCGASELGKALVAAMETSEGRSATRDGLKSELTCKSQAEVKQQVIAALTQVGQILDAKAPADALSFKAWLKHVAEKIAEASSEGGFLGFGGVRVADAEKASIKEVVQALGTQ